MGRSREAGIIDYHEPTTIDEAVSLLASDEGARCLAGGAALVAMMNFGIMEPSILVSLRRIEELRGIHPDEQGGLRIGAMTTHREVAAEKRLVGCNDVVREAAASIDVAIRNMGTIGGAISHADPASDLNTALVAAGARAEIAGPGGRRTVPLDEFFSFYLTTVLEPNEVVTAVRLPGAQAGSVGAFDKVCRVHGDTPTLSAAVTLEFEADVISNARLVIGACGPVPIRVADADAHLIGHTTTDATIEAACVILAEAAEPPDDVRGSAEYRRLLLPRVAKRLIRRAIKKRELSQ